MGRPHVTYEQIIAYAAGTLAGPEMAKIEAHLAAHPRDAQTVARYRLARHVMATDDSVEPSLAAIARAKAVYKPQANLKGLGWLEAVDRFIAKLVFDSRVQAVGLRHSQTEDRINLTFESDQIEIDLQAERSGEEGWQLMGQVSFNEPNEQRGGAVALAFAGSTTIIAETRADERGGFSFETRPGKYDVFIQTPQGVMVAPNVEIV